MDHFIDIHKVEQWGGKTVQPEYFASHSQTNRNDTVLQYVQMCVLDI